MYINTKTKAYPVTEYEIRASYPFSIFAVPFVPPAGYEFVFPTPQPQHDVLTQVVAEIAPAKSSKGQYEQQWRVDTLPADQIAANIASKKQALLAAVTAKRDETETLGFPYLGKVIDSDPRSVQRINTAAQAAMLASMAAQPFAVEWTCADNSTIQVDAEKMVAMPAALAAHANALHEHARTLKAAIQAAANAQELSAIDISAGWLAV